MYRILITCMLSMVAAHFMHLADEAFMSDGLWDGLHPAISMFIAYCCLTIVAALAFFHKEIEATIRECKEEQQLIE